MHVPPPGAGPPAGGNCARTTPCHAPVCPPKAAWRRRNALTRPHFSAKDSRESTEAKTVNGALPAVKARLRLLPVRPIPYAAGGSNGTRPAPRVRGNRRRTNASAKAADGAAHISAAQQRHSAGGTNAAGCAATLVESAAVSPAARNRPPAPSGPAPVSRGQSSRAERSKAPGRMMRPGASAVSSSGPVSFRQGRSAQPGRRRFCPFAASAASRPPSRRYVSGAAPIFMRTSAGRTGSYRSPSGTRLRPRCPDPDCAGRSVRRSRR